MKLVLFDTETTGFQDDDRIIQAGMVVLDTKGSPAEIVEDLCKAHKPLPIEAMEVNNITPEMLEGKPLFAETEFKKRLDELNMEENCLIAHNIDFDIGMLEKEGFECKMRKIDTIRCARHLFPDLPHHRLQYLRYALGLYKGEQEEAEKLGVKLKAHDAIGDVLVMKLLLRKLTEEIVGKYPKSNQIEKLIELSETPVLMKNIHFGKHKGKSFEEVAKTDRGYLVWLKNNSDNSNVDLHHTIDHWLG